MRIFFIFRSSIFLLVKLNKSTAILDEVFIFAALAGLINFELVLAYVLDAHMAPDHGLRNFESLPRELLSFVHFMLSGVAFKSLFGSSFCGGFIAKELFAISAIGRIADKIELVVFNDIKPVIPD